MPRRVLFATMLAMSLLAAAPVMAEPDEEPTFVLGFKTLAGLIPDVVGAPLENEHHNPINGDGLQMTSTGLMVWRKLDNWTAFTNGWWTWVNGPYGLQDRANEERFDWEQEVEATARATAASEDLAASPSRAAIAPMPAAAPAIAALPTATPGELFYAGLPTGTPTATIGLAPTSLPTATGTPAPTPSPRPTATRVPTRRPSPTPRPTATPVPTPTPRPTATAVPTPTIAPTATQVTDGIRSPDPAGEWVTSVSEAAKYYCSKSSSYWQTWAAANRIWFATESDLLRVYPGRIRRD